MEISVVFSLGLLWTMLLYTFLCMALIYISVMKYISNSGITWLQVWVVALVDNAKHFSKKLWSLKMGVLTYTPIRNCFEEKIGLTSPFLFSLLGICLGNAPMPSIKSLKTILSGSFSSSPAQLQVTLKQSTPLLLKTEIHRGCSLNLRNSKS